MNKNRKAGKFMKNKVRYQSKTDLKLLRELHHLSKECVANYINYSTRTLERIEKENAVTTEYTARQLCDLYLSLIHI